MQFRLTIKMNEEDETNVATFAQMTIEHSRCERIVCVM